jgi:hypothetical protein
LKSLPRSPSHRSTSQSTDPVRLAEERRERMKEGSS